MCKASKYLGELEKLIQGINEDFKILTQKQAEYDTMISDYYHKIENATFNACEGYYLAKQFQEIARKRRIIKDEFYRLNTLKQTLQIGQMEATVNKSKSSVKKTIENQSKYYGDWRSTYSLEELLH